MKAARAVGVFLATVAIYLGICLLGWGLFDLAEFFSRIPYLAYAGVVGIFGLLVGIQAYHSLEGIQDSKSPEGKVIRRQTAIAVLLVVILALGMFFLPFCSRRGIAVFPASAAPDGLGVFLSFVGYLLVYWSGVALGRQYSAQVTIQQDHQLITIGPYRLIRHPRYLGILCLSLALSLLFHSWAGLSGSLVVGGLVLARISDEEDLLQSEFGKIWQTYCQRSWKLIPYLY
jgi:protein-S-isoprenylcysteine O-methyltransferase Ste14